MWDQPENNGAVLIHYDNEKESCTEYRFEAVDPFDIQIAHFYNCLVRREQGHPDVIDGFNVDVIIEAIEASAQRKTSVKLDWRGF
jgi:predicted dehydrogenase